MEALIFQAVDEVALEGAEGILDARHSVDWLVFESSVLSSHRIIGLSPFIVWPPASANACLHLAASRCAYCLRMSSVALVAASDG